MRVLSVSSVFPNPVQPRHGVFVRQRLAALAAHHDVTVIAPVPWFPIATGRMLNRPAGVVGERTDGALRVFHPRWLSPPAIGKSIDGYLYAAAVARLARRLHREKPFDLVDAHFAYPDGFGARLVARALGVPMTVTLRGTLPDLARRRSRRWALRRTLREADGVIAVSADLARDAEMLGLPRERVRVVPNGIDTDRFRVLDRHVARQRLGLPADRAVIVSVGALREVKGHHHLLHALARLRSARPDAMVVFVGGASVSDDRSAELRELARELDLGDAVIWAGSRPHAEIPEWLAAADVFALASRREGCCNAILEALACGRPVVATAVGGNPEIITGDHLGRLVPPGDAGALAEALERVLAEPWEPAAIRAAVDGRGWNRTAEAVVEAWQEALIATGRATTAPVAHPREVAP